MADTPQVDLAAAARLLTKWLDEVPLNPEKSGPAIDLWLTLFGFTTDPDDPTYEDGLGQAVLLAFDLADPPGKQRGPGGRIVADVIVEGEVL